jgi:hypothetical protein
MLIICNGAFKSGSTWLFNILRFTVKCVRIPPEFHDEKEWRGESIAEDKLPLFLKKIDYRNKNYISKNHYYETKTRDLLLTYDDVYIFNIKRDIRDVIVSAYYHFKREEGLNQTFEEYYWQRGKNLIWYMNDYHAIWSAREAKIHVTSYNGLLEDFENEARQISTFLDYPLKPGVVKRLRNQTTIEESRKLWREDSKPPEECFFRKGIIGDWKNHFTPEIEADYNEIQRVETLKFSKAELPSKSG